MNADQKIHFEYGRKLLEKKRWAQDSCDRTGGHEDKVYGNLLLEAGLHIDPLTHIRASRPVQAACLWAAQDKERFQAYVTKNPRCKTVRGLHNLYKSEQIGEDLDPSVYVYRMYGPISGQVLEPQICKIGCADRGAAARVASQSKKAAVGYIPKIELNLKCREPASLEKLLHKKLRDRKVDVPGREWFQVVPEEVEEAVQSLEHDGKLWRDGEWVCIGSKPPQQPKSNDRDKVKLAAKQIYRKFLPSVIVFSDDSACHEALCEATGLAPERAKAGLNWLIEKGYLDKSDGGLLTPSAKFHETWRKQQSVKTVQ